MEKKIEKLQFITMDISGVPHSEQAIRAIRSGCRWVQLRMKEATDEQVLAEAKRIQAVARENAATLIINDRVHLVAQCSAHGVHLGKMDMDVAEARALLGHDKIIGATTNNFSDIQTVTNQSPDYIGLGPYRFTTTKKNLSPVLGLEGYQQLLQQMNEAECKVPVIAIGGILDADIPALLDAGVYGIALAGAIVAGNRIETNIKKYNALVAK